MSWQAFPIITCPHCNKEFQVDDYYDIKSGDSFYCQHCDKEIYVWQIDTTLSGDIQSYPESEFHQKHNPSFKMTPKGAS